jgi:hypothetical protein
LSPNPPALFPFAARCAASVGQQLHVQVVLRTRILSFHVHSLALLAYYSTMNAS